MEEGTICLRSTVSRSRNAIIAVAKDILLERATRKELCSMPRLQKSQGMGESRPEPSGYKLTENHTVQKIAWWLGFHSVYDLRHRSLTYYSAAACISMEFH